MKHIIKINIEVKKMDKEILDDLIAFANKLNKTKEDRPATKTVNHEMFYSKQR